MALENFQKYYMADRYRIINIKHNLFVEAIIIIKNSQHFEGRLNVQKSVALIATAYPNRARYTFRDFIPSLYRLPGSYMYIYQPK